MIIINTTIHSVVNSNIYSNITEIMETCLMTGFKTYQNRCGVYLTAEENTYLENANEHYAINGVFSDGHSCGFTYTESGDITYRCQKKVGFASIACTMNIDKKSTNISLCLSRNGSLITGCNSSITFEKSFSYQTLVAFKNIELNYGDVFSLHLISDKADVTATVSSVQLIMWTET